MPAVDGSTIDIEQPGVLVAYLRAGGHIAPDEAPDVRVLAGGVSNKTLLVSRANGDSWVIKQALARLRVQADWFSDPRRIHQEGLGLRHVAELLPPGCVPALIFEDQTQHILAMRAIPTPHENWKTMLLRGDLHLRHIEQFGALLAHLHRGGREGAARLRAIFDEYSFFETLRLSPYYEYTATQVPQAADFIHVLIERTRAIRETVVHGDYSPKNVLVHQDKLILLDYEVIHMGDPAFDIGFSMTHLLSKSHYVESSRLDFAAAAKRYWAVYLEGSEPLPGLEPRCVQHTLACLLARVAGKSQLEYLNDAQRARQRTAVTALIAELPATMPDLIDGFVAHINRLSRT
jgi:tRNA A-37 threonylcarbamoyl transferase component Bud32